MQFVGHKQKNFRGNDRFSGEPIRVRLHEQCTVVYAKMNVIGSRSSVVIAFIRSNIH